MLKKNNRLAGYRVIGFTGLTKVNPHTRTHAHTLTKKGFTLIELIVVSSLVAVIAVGVYTTLSQGIKIWNRLNNSIYEEDLNIFLDKLTQDLRNSIKFKGIKFIGTKNEVRFGTMIIAPFSQGALERVVGEAVYSFDAAQQAVTRSQRNLSQIYADKQDPAHALLKSVKQAAFQYYSYDTKEKEYLWQEEWIKEGLPEAVRIEFDFNDELQNDHLTRTIFIPASGWLK